MCVCVCGWVGAFVCVCVFMSVCVCVYSMCVFVLQPWVNANTKAKVCDPLRWIIYQGGAGEAANRPILHKIAFECISFCT